MTGQMIPSSHHRTQSETSRGLHLRPIVLAILVFLLLDIRATTSLSVKGVPSHPGGATRPKTVLHSSPSAPKNQENQEKKERSPPVVVATRGASKQQPPSMKNNNFNSISNQLKRRVAADPNFVAKSVTELTLACGTQLLAEVGRRGLHRLAPEIDFVAAGVLTAVAGKYYSMWRVAPTAPIDGDDDWSHEEKTREDPSNKNGQHDRKGDDSSETSSWTSRIPTNAFQDTCLDGSTPTIPMRLAALVAPVPALFRAGVVASALGYGSAAILIWLRSVLVPSYVVQTKGVNVPAACLYTGCFMAVVSNLRYQLLQGLVEPKFIDKFFSKYKSLHAALIFLVRFGNGVLGSVIAISGMKWLGLQKLK